MSYIANILQVETRQKFSKCPQGAPERKKNSKFSKIFYFYPKLLKIAFGIIVSSSDNYGCEWVNFKGIQGRCLMTPNSGSIVFKFNCQLIRMRFQNRHFKLSTNWMWPPAATLPCHVHCLSKYPKNIKKTLKNYGVLSMGNFL